MPLWNELEGQSLNGLPLRTLLRSEGRTAWFATTDSAGQPAVVSVIETLNDEDAVEARLRAAARVPHPNILILRSIGKGRVADESLVYAVMEPFDQTLAEVLRDRTLAPEEAREVSDSLLSALEAIDAAGLRHGHVDASGVLAVGDSIKLRSDCLAQRAGEADAPALAALVYNALTGRRLANERDALQLPAPFATLVRAGLGSAGSLAAMRRVLHGPAVTSATPATAAPAPSAPPPASAAAPPATSATSAGAPGLAQSGQVFAQPPTPAPAPRTKTAPPPPAAPRSPRSYPPTSPRNPSSVQAATRRPSITIAAIGMMLLVLLALYFTFRRPPAHTQITGGVQPSVSANEPPAASASTPNPAAIPANQAASTMGAASPPNPTRPPARPSAALLPPSVPGGSTERTAWHVIVYTYTRQDAAQHKAEELAQRYPQLEPQVFSPHGRAPYLVTLGGAMDRDAAMARRDAARKAGLPRDTYAQNYRK